MKQLELIRRLQESKPDMAVAGSFACMIYGIDLKRSLELSDIDFIKPDVSGLDLSKMTARPSCNYDQVYTASFGCVPIEVAIDPEIKSEVVYYQRNVYRVVLIEKIIELKEIYFNKTGAWKHHDDLVQIEKQFKNVTYGIRNHIHSL